MSVLWSCFGGITGGRDRESSVSSRIGCGGLGLVVIILLPVKGEEVDVGEGGAPPSACCSTIVSATEPIVGS